MPSNKHLLAILTLTFAGLFAGCQTISVPNSTLPRLSGNEPMTQLDFWHAIAAKSLINNDEAFHGLLLDLDGKDTATSYDQRVALLKSRHLLAHGFKEPADQALERGTISIAGHSGGGKALGQAVQDLSKTGDAVADVTLVEASRLLTPIEGVGAWLFRVARNRIIRRVPAQEAAAARRRRGSRRARGPVALARRGPGGGLRAQPPPRGPATCS